jgi:hypothetical protein
VRKQSWWGSVLLAALLPLVLVFLLLWLIGAVALLLLVWLTWLPRRRYALVVYSNSPVWQGYFESRILPQVGERAGILNWSERGRWRPTLSVFLFRVFAGSREYNPIAIVFEPLSWPRQFRFYDAFRAFKHGKPAEVERLRQEFLALLDELAPPPAGVAPSTTS